MMLAKKFGFAELNLLMGVSETTMETFCILHIQLINRTTSFCDSYQ